MPRRSRQIRRCIYCGDKRPLPRGWDSRGTPSYCVKVGFGAGMHLERRKWQRRMRIRVDPEYVSHCGENAVYERQIRNRRNFRQSRNRRRNYRSNRRRNNSRSRRR